MKKLTFILLLVGLSFVGYGQNIRGNSLWSRTTIASDTTYTPTGTEPTGTAYYDKENRTISVALGNGVVMQFNQESMIQVHNGSGATIMNGRVLGAIGGANDRVSVGYADKSKRYDNLIMSTEVIPADSSGLAVEIAGRVNGVNTGGFPVGKIYLDTLGLITAEQGVFPDYNYPIGSVVKTGITDGIIQFRSDGVNFRNSINDAFDGAVRETFDFRTFSDGTTVYGVLSNPTGADNLTLMFSNGWFDYPVPDTIPLTAGTATNPQSSYVYIDKETRTLQSNTTGFDNTIEHAQIAKIALLDAATTQTYGAIRNQNTNNHLKYDHNNGHIVHLGERMRVLNAQWESGVGLTVSGTPTNLYLATTAGKVWQLHLQSFPAQDMSAGSDIHIVNDFTTPYRTTTNLNTVSTYSDGSTWNNEWQNLVVWGVANKTGETSHIMMNLSSEGYQSEEDAFEDANNYSSYIIPRTFRGVGFLIGRITVRRSPAGYEYNPSTGFLNLLGYYPNNTAGGGTGASGITDFLQLEDTPSSYLGEAFKFVRVASGETALEFVGGEQILLTDFDTTGFIIDTSQVNGLDVFRNDIAINQQAIIDSSASLQGQIDLNTTHRLSDGDLSATNELQTISKVGSTVTLSDGGGSFTDENTQLSQSQVNAYESDPTVSTYTKSLTSASKLLTEIKTVDGSGSGLDADLLDGYSSLRYLHKTYYSASSGILVQTDIPYPSNTMFTMEVTGNGYHANDKINISTQGYVYSASGTILAAKGIADNYSETIYYQIRNGYLYIWFPAAGSYQTYNIEVFAGNTSESMINRVVNVSNSTKPTDATIEVSFVPKERWHSGNFDPATKQDLLTGNETVFDGWDKNVADDFSGDYLDLINKPTIPTVNNSTITLQRNGASIGNFTLNQSTNEAFNFIDENTTYSLTTTGNSGAASLVGNVINVPNYVTGLSNGYIPYFTTQLINSPIMINGTNVLINTTSNAGGYKLKVASALAAQFNTGINANISIILSGGRGSFASINDAGTAYTEMGYVASKHVFSLGDIDALKGITVTDAPILSNDVIRKVDIQNASLWADLDYLEINGTERISSTGAFTGTTGTFSSTVTASGGNSTNWNDAYNNKITSASVTGTTTKTITLNQQDGGTVTASFTDENTTYSLTTNNNSGASTLVGTVFNIPRYDVYTDNELNALGLNSGTENNFTYWTPTGLSSSSPIYTDGSNIRIGGSVAPVAAVHIIPAKSDVAGGGFMKFTDNTTTYRGFGIRLTGTGENLAIDRQFVTDLEVLRILRSNGNILINKTSDDGNKLQVNGDITIATDPYDSSWNGLQEAAPKDAVYDQFQTLNTAEWDDAYDNKITSAKVTGTTTKTITLNQQDGGTVTASFTDETVTDGDKGDITVSGSGATWDIDNSGVTAGNYTNASFDVDADGRITYAQSYRGQIGYSGVSVYANNTQTATSSGTILSFGGEQYDTDSYHDTGTSNRLTMPTLYASSSIAKVTISMQFKALSNFTGKVELIKNGTTVIREWDLQDSGLTGQMSVYAAENFLLSAGDYLQIKVTTTINTTSATSVNLRPQVSVELVKVIT